MGTRMDKVNDGPRTSVDSLPALPPTNSRPPTYSGAEGDNNLHFQPLQHLNDAGPLQTGETYSSNRNIHEDGVDPFTVTEWHDDEDLSEVDSNSEDITSERIQDPKQSHFSFMKNDDVKIGSNTVSYGNRMDSTATTITPSIIVQKDLEKVNDEKKKIICGLSHRMFWVSFATIIMILLVIMVGSIIGTRVKRHSVVDRVPNPFEKYTSTLIVPNPTYTPAPPEIGGWNINKRVDVETGICGSNPAAVFGCVDPLQLSFNILKVPGGYRAEQEEGSMLNRQFKIPQKPGELWSINVFDDKYPVYTLDGRECQTTANATVMVGPSYEYHVIFHYMNPKPCQVGNGQISQPGHFCHCEWKGHIYGKDEPKASATSTQMEIGTSTTELAIPSQTTALTTSGGVEVARETNGPATEEELTTTSTVYDIVTITISSQPVPTSTQ